ncbi:MAG: DUF5667 domain-containing protein [Dehalococcoidia bacterium]
MSRELEEILNDCIDRLIEGESIEACLTKYPQHAEELKPLLQAAQIALSSSALEPRPEFKAAARYRFQSAIRERGLKPRRRWFSLPNLFSRWGIGRAKEGREMEEVLNDCVDRLIEGESIQRCLARYPQWSSELEPLLETAQTVLSLSSFEAPQEFKAALKERVLSAIIEEGTKTSETGHEFGDALSDGIDRLQEGAHIEECLDQHPQYAEELKPLLQAAQIALGSSAIEPRPEFKAAARYRFQSAIKKRGLKPRSRWFALPDLASRWGIGVAALAIVFLIGAGTIRASNDSLPGEPLYTVKQWVEDTRLFFTNSDIGDARLHAQFANRRFQEIEGVARKGEIERVARLQEQLNYHLSRASALSQDTSILNEKIQELRALLESHAERNEDDLLKVLDEVSENDKPILREAIQQARERYREAIQSLE